jgi:pilus assembly protein TadC
MTTAHGAGRRLYRVVGAAVATGSSLLDSVARLAHDFHSELAASELEAVRKLPVTMLFPLTLLILPGFLLVAIAPAILDAFSRLELSP